MSGEMDCMKGCGGKVDFTFGVLTIELSKPCRRIEACACNKCGRVYEFISYKPFSVLGGDGVILEVFSINEEYVTMSPVQVKDHLEKIKA